MVVLPPFSLGRHLRREETETKKKKKERKKSTFNQDCRFRKIHK